MKKRLQVILTDDAWNVVERIYNDVNDGFDAGHINYSDAINEMILTSNVNVKELRKKHTDLRRSLRSLASKPDIDVESVLRCLQELKGIVPKKSKATSRMEELDGN